MFLENKKILGIGWWSEEVVNLKKHILFFVFGKKNIYILGVGWWKVERGKGGSCGEGKFIFWKTNLVKLVKYILSEPYLTKFIFAHNIFGWIVVQTIFSQFIFNLSKFNQTQLFVTPLLVPVYLFILAYLCLIWYIILKLI